MKAKIICLLLLAFNVSAQEVTVSSVEDLFELALSRNVSLKNAALQRELAAMTRKIAAVNAFSPRVPVSWQALDHIALQSTYVPGTIFGQPEGTYKELVMGQKYAATLNLSPQFDILHFGNLAQRRAAALNEEITGLEQKKAERDLFLDINAAFHNVISYDRQRVILEENLDLARKIHDVVRNRREEGIARNQEVNEAEVNVLTLENNLDQLEVNRALQTALLKLLTRTDIRVQDGAFNGGSFAASAEGHLDTDLARTRLRAAEQDVVSARKEQWPVLSAVSSFNWQNLGNQFFYGAGGNPIYFAYVGLKISWDLPTNAQKISHLTNKQVQWKMAENNLKMAEEQEQYANFQRSGELEKSRRQLEAQQKIEALKKDTFDKNYAQFEENILPLDQLLISQTDWLASSLNRAAGSANLKFNYHVLMINNRY